MEQQGSLVEYGSRRVIITITAVFCALLEIIDTTIVNVALNVAHVWAVCQHRGSVCPMHNFKLYRDATYLNEVTYPVHVGSGIPKLGNWLIEQPIDVFLEDERSQRSVAILARAQEIDVGRFPKFIDE